MISWGLLRYILCVSDLRFLLYTKFSLIWFILSSMRRLRYFALIVLVSISPLRWDLSYSLKVSFSSSHALTRMNKMEHPGEITVTYLRLLALCWYPFLFIAVFGQRLFLPMSTLLTSPHRQFYMKDLGHLWYFLGLEIAQTEPRILISQQKYTSDNIVATLTDTKIEDTPLEFHSKLLPLDGTPLADPTRYRQLVGKLVYLCLTRSDIAHAVSIISQFVSASHSAHFSVLLWILRYLRGTITRSLFISSTSSLELRVYSDADWVGCPYTRRSTTSFRLFLGDSLISGKKQEAWCCFMFQLWGWIQGYGYYHLGDRSCEEIFSRLWCFSYRSYTSYLWQLECYKRLPPIQSFMKWRSTLRSIATSLVSISLQALYHSHIFAQRSILQTSLRGHILQRDLESCWANSCCLTHHEFEGGVKGSIRIRIHIVLELY